MSEGLRGNRPVARNPIGRVVAQRRWELGLPRAQFRWRSRLQHLEFTAKVPSVMRLLKRDGSEEIIDRLGLSLADLEALADGDLSEERVLERARRRIGDPVGDRVASDQAVAAV